ncbi:MAG: hypothetical protein V2I48_06075 [Xanthomonadales bacterium]|nr:hypothetical protein [Xanthomonadales bacterium]
MNSGRVADLLSAERLSEGARVHYSPDTRPDELIFKLCDDGFWQDAITVASCTLPPREAVWWACVCARKMASIAENPAEMLALESAETWVYKPSEDHRKKAFEFAQASDPCRAGGLCAFAATFNDCKIPLVDGSEVELDKGVFSGMVSGAVMMAASDAGPEQVFKRFKRFIESAGDIANGGGGRMADMEE